MDSATVSASAGRGVSVAIALHPALCADLQCPTLNGVDHWEIAGQKKIPSNLRARREGARAPAILTKGVISIDMPTGELMALSAKLVCQGGSHFVLVQAT